MRVEKYMKQGSIIKRATRGERVIGSLFPNRGTGWPGGWSQDRLEQVMHMKNWTYVAVDTIWTKAASVMPNMAYVVDAPKPGVTTKASNRGLMNITDGRFGGGGYIASGGSTFITMGEYHSKALSVVKPHEELEPLESNHPLRMLMENPNPVDTSFDLIYELGMFLDLCGVTYLWLVPNDWGIPCELWTIPAHWVWPRTGGGGYVNPENPHANELISYYEIRPWGGVGSAGILKFPPNEVVMIRRKSPLNKLDGYSPLAAVAQWIDSEESISKSRWSQFMNIARPELWVELGPGFEDPDQDAIARIEAKFQAKLQGEYNYGKPLITPPGAKVNALSFSPTEMAYFQSEEQIRDMILSTFRVPKSAVGISQDMTYGSLLASLAGLCEYCLNPRLAMLGLSLTKHLAHRWSEEGRKVKLWWDNCLDDKTECLTSNGWVNYRNLSNETEIACYDDKTNTIIYRKPKRIIRRKHEGNIYVWKGGRVSAAMTAEHRVWSRKRQKTGESIPDWGFTTAEELQESSQTVVIKRAAPAACSNPVPITIDHYDTSYKARGMVRRGLTPKMSVDHIDPHLWLEFLGYFISEGHISQNDHVSSPPARVVLSQNKGTSCYKKILNCISSLPLGEWKERRVHVKKYPNGNYAQFRCTNRGLAEHLSKHCGEGARNKKVPEYVKDWPAESLRVLLDALIAGDGRKPYVNKNTGVWNSQYTTMSKQLADDVMELAIKCGLSASIRLNGEWGWQVNLSSRVEVTVQPNYRSVVNYSGEVWCVDVPTGKFVVRREGKAHITGNCVPADPTQVNSDLSTDLSHYAITPNEVRALRGRKPYRSGGDDPLAQGPGGMMPLPLNTGEDLSELAQLIAPMTQAEGKGEENKPLGNEPGKPSETPKTDKPQEQTMEQAQQEIQQQETVSPAGIEQPNGEPNKMLRNYLKKTLGPHKFSSTQVNLPKGNVTNIIEEMQASIPEEMLVEDGLETDLHITALYGIHAQEADEVRELLQGIGPIKAKLGMTSLFKRRDDKSYDVVKIDVISPDLQAINAILSDNLPHTNSYLEYIPHVTLAYVAPGEGGAFVGMRDVDGVVVTFNKIQFSNCEGEVETVFLERQLAQLAKSVRKDKGTCKPGERSDLTGCTPATESHTGKPQTSQGDKPSNKVAGAIESEATTPPKGSKGVPDVEKVDPKTGVTDSSRVGVPALVIPPPPGIPRLPNLTEHERKVESSFIQAFESDPDGVAKKYLDLVHASTKEGEAPVFATDDAKALTNAWSEADITQRSQNRATLNTPLHQTANAVAKRAFLQHLDTMDKGDEILVTVGGCGAGKGYALKNVPEALALKKQSKVVWDSAGDQNATENPWIQQEAEKRGLKVNYVYVNADPKTQWAHPEMGVVKRAGDPKDGRMVGCKVFADSYAIGAKNMKAFYDKNKDNKNATFIFLQNGAKPKKLDGVPEEALNIDRQALAKFAAETVKNSDAPAHVKRGALMDERIWE